MKKLVYFVAMGFVLLLLVMTFFSFIYKGQRSTIQASSTLTQAELVSKGAYLARMGNCLACHSDPADNNLVLAGGQGLASPIGMIYGTNITPDVKTGIGSYTLQNFDNAMRYGVRQDGDSLYPAMPYPSYAVVRDEDIEALYAYLMHGVEPVARENKPVEIMWPLSMRWPLAGWRMVFAPKVKAK
ncbi:MAG: c-type cytochrome [Saezia sp.]